MAIPGTSGRRFDSDGFWAPDGALDWPAPVLLKRLRLMRGLTQKELAQRAQVVQSHVSKTEAGSDVRLSTMLRLIDALGCRLSLRVRPVTPFEMR
jgi:DNA-binding Xre family transcriptional regulator